jgi:hypothetical protein
LREHSLPILLSIRCPKPAGLILALSLLIVPAYSEGQTVEKVVAEVMDSVEARFRDSYLAKTHGHREQYYSRDDMIYPADPVRAKVMTLINGFSLLDFLRDGEFKNQHQTKYSGGGGEGPKVRRMRLDIEENLSGIDLRKRVKKEADLHRVLPKYGMVEFHDMASNPQVQRDWSADIKTLESDVYGEIAIYFKDSVKSRTTMIPTDSGNFGARKRMGEWVQSLRQKRVLLDFQKIDYGEFFEAQIWGKLTVAEVDYVVVPRELFYDASADLNKIIEALHKKGIPVYEFKTRNFTSQEARLRNLRVKIRGPRIYNGSCLKL